MVLDRALERYRPRNELGGRPDGDEFYDEQDHVLYGRLAGAQQFQNGIERVLRGAKADIEELLDVR